MRKKNQNIKKTNIQESYDFSQLRINKSKEIFTN